MDAPTDIDELDWMLQMEMDQGEEEEREEVYYRGPGGRFVPHSGAEEPFSEDQCAEESANAALQGLEGPPGPGRGVSGSAFDASQRTAGAATTAQPSAFVSEFGNIAGKSAAPFLFHPLDCRCLFACFLPPFGH